MLLVLVSLHLRSIEHTMAHNITKSPDGLVLVVFYCEYTEQYQDPLMCSTIMS